MKIFTVKAKLFTRLKRNCIVNRKDPALFWMSGKSGLYITLTFCFTAKSGDNLDRIGLYCILCVGLVFQVHGYFLIY